MKYLKTLYILLLLVTITSSANAQIKDWLNRKKEEAKQKVNNKIDQKTNEGLDKVIDAPEKAAKKKKGQKGVAQTTDKVTENSTVEDAKPVGEIIINTNIKCAVGKATIEDLIRDTPGVTNVSIDIKTGKLYIGINGDATNKEEIEAIIRKNGFEANGKKKLDGINSCN